MNIGAALPRCELAVRAFFRRLGTRRENSCPRRICASRIEPLETRIALTVNMVSGNIPNGTVWHDGDIEYITADATVQMGATLTIEPGAIVKFAYQTNLFVDGTLLADGTAAQPIIFTSYRDDSAGNDDTDGGGSSSGVPGDWNSLKFGATSTGSVMNHTEVRFGGGGIAEAAVVVDHAQLSLTNSLVTDSRYNGLRILGSNPTLTGDTFVNSGAYIGAIAGGIRMDLDSNPAISGVTMSHNSINGLMVDGGTLTDSRTWNDPDIVYWLTNNVTVPADMTLTVAPGQIIKMTSGIGLFVDGTLLADGTAAQPILFTSYRDDSAGGDTNGGGASTGSPGDWGAIQFRSGSEGSVMNHTEVRDGGLFTPGEVVIDHAELSLTNSVVSRSSVDGLRIVGSNPTLTNVTFSDNAAIGHSYGALSMDLDSEPAITGVTMSNNGINALQVDGGTMTGSHTWNNPDVVYWLYSQVTVPASATLTVGPGQIIKSSVRLLVEGTLLADGTTAQPIVFTSHPDDSAGGDTSGDGASSGVPGDWYAVHFTNGSTGTLDHVEVRYTNLGVFATDTGTMVTVSNSILTAASSICLNVTLGATVIATNNVILGASNIAGIFTASGAHVTAINNTINNCFIGVDVAGGEVTLTNNLITNNTGVGVRGGSVGGLTMSFNDVFNPGKLNYSDGPDLTGTNGNVSADPKYFNAASQQFQLRAGSPVIDAGTNVGAPLTDRLGHPRFDDPNVVGNGIVDLGALERQETATSDVDLRAVSVSGPATGLQGDTVTVNWMVESLGPGAAIGSWFDAIYLSADAVLTPDDLFLGDAQHTGDLGAGGSYMASKQVTLPGVLPDDYYFIVRANSRNEVFEGLALSNNVAASTGTIAMDLPTLTFGAPVNASLPSGAPLYYKINASAGADLKLTLDGTGGGSNELYLKFGDIPSRQSFDARGTTFDSPNQTISFPSAIAGTYYAMVFDAKPGFHSFTLTASQPTFDITDISPTRGSNTGEVTVLIHGAHFDVNSQAQLVDSGGHTIPAAKVYFTDSGSIAATFNLTGAPLGAADVQVVNTGNVTATLTDALEVVAGSPGRFSAKLLAPNGIRPTGFLAYLEYDNLGDTDVLAPLLKLDAVTNRVVFSFHPDRADAAPTLYFLATNDEGPAGILPPGAQVIVPIYATGVFSNNGAPETVTLDLGIAASQTIPWAEVEPSIRPENLTEAQFAPVYSQLQTNVGATFAEYTAQLSRAATLLPRGDAGAPSLQDVFQQLAYEAAADVATSVSGRLFLGDQAHPLAGAELLLHDATTGNVVESTSLTDGTFVFPVVADGDYSLSIDGFVLGAPVSVNVAGDASLGNVVVTRGGSINGGILLDVAGQPLRNVPVIASGGDGMHNTTTDNNGRFTLTSLSAGTYEVMAGSDLYTYATREIVLGAGETKQHVNLVLQAAGTIGGTVTGPGGPIADATVSALAPDGSGFSALTDATGKYTIPSLGGAAYTLSASAPGLAAVVAPNVVLPAAGNLTGINFALGVAGGVAGHVMAAVGGAAAPDVIVKLVGPGGTFEAQTDANGDYALDGLAPGSYAATTSSDDFMTKTANAMVVASNTLSLPLSLAVRGHVSGTVTAIGSNAPVPKVIVSAVDANGLIAETTTDASGHYDLDGLDAGTVQIVLGDEFAPGLTRTAATFDFNNTARTVDFPIQVAGTVTGTVFEADGVTPLENAVVGLVQNGEKLVSMFTDDLGHYSFVVTGPGTYQLEASGAGVAYPAITGVTLGGGNTITGQNFTPGTKMITGLVRDAATMMPIAGATLNLSRTEAGLVLTGVDSTITAADGTFTFTGEVPGDYRVTAADAAHAFAIQSFTVTNGAPPNLTFDLGAAGAVSGTVRDADTGMPLANARLVLSTASGPALQFITRSDDHGAYNFAGLTAGSYRLSAAASGHETALASSVSVTAGQQVLSPALDPANIHVRGTITNGNNPLGEVTVIARDASGNAFAQAITALDGTYELATLPPGQFTITATGEGYHSSSLAPLSVAEGNDLTGVNLTMTPVGISDILLTNLGQQILTDLKAHTLSPDKLRTTPVDKGYSLNSGNQALLGAVLPDDKCELERQGLLAEVRDLETLRKNLTSFRDRLVATGELESVKHTLDNDRTALRNVVGDARVALSRQRLSESDGAKFVLFEDELEPLFKSLTDWRIHFGGVGGKFNLSQAAEDLEEALEPNGTLGKVKYKATLFAAYQAKIHGLSTDGFQLEPGDQEALAHVSTSMAKGDDTVPWDLNAASVRDVLNTVENLEKDVRNALVITASFTTYDLKLTEYYSSVSDLPAKFDALQACKKKCEPAEETSGLSAAAAAGPLEPFHIGGCDKPPPPNKPTKPNRHSPTPDDSHDGPNYGRIDKVEITLRRSFDPNDKIGPVGFGPQNYLAPGLMPFKILFENDAAHGATAPAQKVVVTDTLDADLDLSTFEFTSFGFGAFEFDVPKGVANYQTTLDLRPDGINLQVPVTISLDITTRVVTATFDSLDPLTGLAPDDVDAGFLPVNNANHDGEGFFTYNVQPKTGLATGTVITNQASIVFDQNGVIPTPTTSHTLDTDAPTSAITTAPSTLAKSAIDLTFQSNDVGSGVGSFEVFVSDNGGAFQPAFSAAIGGSATFYGEPGHTYAFYSLARDHAGNSEAAKTTPETTITLAPAEQIVLDKVHSKLAFADADGTAVKATWSGAGMATIQRFNGTNGRGDIFSIAVTGSDAKSKLTITPTKGDTEVNTIEANSSLSALTMKGVNILDHIKLTSAVASITLGNLVAGAELTLHGTVPKGAKVVVGDVNGEGHLTSTGPLASLQAVRWTDGAITAPSLAKLTITGAKKPAIIAGDFGADLKLADGTPKLTLGGATISGAILGGTWDITGNAGAISALSISANWAADFTGDISQIKTTASASGHITVQSIKTFTVGANLTGAAITLTQAVVPSNAKLEALHLLKITGLLDASTINSSGHLGSVTAGALRDSNILAGVKAGTVGLPDALADFDAAAKIASVTVKGIKDLANAVANSNIAAQILGAITLRDIMMDNGNTDFGLAADKIAALTIFQGKATLDKLTTLDTPTGEAVRHDDFVARVL